MKKQLFYILALLLVAVACGDEDMPVVTPTDKGSVTDDQGNVYEWVRIGGLDWTTTNAKNGPSCAEATYYRYERYYSVFGDEEKEYMEGEYRDTYGNLMLYEDAMASAPDGWRLPTDDDWKQLERTLGMGNEVDELGWRGSYAGTLMMQGEEGTQLNLKLGGAILWTASYGLVLEFMHLNEYGYYWTATVDPSYTDAQTAYYRKLCYGKGGVERRAAKTSRYFSVRWVRDAQ